MIGLYSDETYGARMDYDDRDDDKNAPSGSGSDDLIFDLITLP